MDKSIQNEKYEVAENTADKILEFLQNNQLNKQRPSPELLSKVKYLEQQLFQWSSSNTDASALRPLIQSMNQNIAAKSYEKAESDANAALQIIQDDLGKKSTNLITLLDVQKQTEKEIQQFSDLSADFTHYIQNKEFNDALLTLERMENTFTSPTQALLDQIQNLREAVEDMQTILNTKKTDKLSDTTCTTFWEGYRYDKTTKTCKLESSSGCSNPYDFETEQECIDAQIDLPDEPTTPQAPTPKPPIVLDEYPDNNCITIEEDKSYYCTYYEFNEEDHILVSGEDDYVYSKQLCENADLHKVIDSPSGWTQADYAFSPNRMHALLNIVKNDCPTEVPVRPLSEEALTCGNGRGMPWAGRVVETDRGKVWKLENLGYPLGPVHDWSRNMLMGWPYFVHNELALFVGWYAEEDKALFPPGAEIGEMIFQVEFDGGEVNIGPYQEQTMFDSQCLNGRTQVSHVKDQDTCTDGQILLFPRKCRYEPNKPEAGDPVVPNWAWYNTKNLDGTGGKCRDDLPSLPDATIKLFTLELDASCTPKGTYDLANPIESPRTDGVFRHMGHGGEWGQMIPTLSNDGKVLVFVQRKGFDYNNPEDNCGAHRANPDDLNEMNGDGAARIYYCFLDDDHRCTEPSKPVVRDVRHRSPNIATNYNV